MKRIIKRILSLSLSALIIAASLNLSLIALADNGVSAYLGDEIYIKDTFEYSSGISLWDIWETSLYNGENNNKNASKADITTQAEIVADPTNASNNVLKLGTNSKKNGTVGIFPKDAYIPKNRKIKSFSFDIYLQNTSSCSYVTYYKGAKLNDSSVVLSNAVGIRPKDPSDGIQVCTNGSTVKYWAYNMPLSYGVWTNIRISYVYQSGRLYGFKLKIGENAEQSFTYNVGSPYTPLDSMKEDNFTYGFTFGASASLVDNIAFNYEVLATDSAQLVAEDFRINYADTLAITESTATASNKAAVDAAIAAYDKLSDDAKELLTTEKTRLDAVLAKIISTEIEAFRTAHSDILSKTKDTATSSDIDALNAAVNAFLDLSAVTQSALSEQKTNLYEISRALKGDAIDAQIIGSYGEFFDDFEYQDGIIPADIYETSVFSPADKPRENDTSLKGNIVASPTDSGNKVLLLDAAKEAYTYIYTLNSNYYPLDRHIESISLKYYTGNTDPKQNVGLVLYSGKASDGTVNLVNLGFRSLLNTANIAFVLNKSVVNWADATLAMPKSAWADLKVDFVYSGTKLTGFTLTVDAGNGPIRQTYDYSKWPNALAKMMKDGFKVGLSFGTAKAAYVDDLRFNFSKTSAEIAEEAAAAFKATHSAILGKTPESVTDADKAAYDAAFTAYGELSATAQSLLTEEFALLSNIAKKFYPTEYATMQKFITDYGTLLSREDSEYTKDDLANLKKTYDAYEALGEREQILTAYPYKAKIDSALKYINDNPQDVGDIGNYKNGYEIFADFEYVQNPFVLVAGDEETASGKIVADPQDPDNNVFAMERTKATYAIWQIDEKLWPNGSAQVTKFSFKFLSYGVDNFVTPLFIYEYTDAKNFKSLSYQSLNTTGVLEKLDYNDGVKTLTQIAGNSIIFGEWMYMQFTFSGTNLQVLLSTSKGSIVKQLSFNAGSKIAFGFVSTSTHKCSPVYIDDVTLQIKEGDFDVNEENHEIYPYYQGNTFQNPDETVLITGDSYFGTNVESAELYTLPDTAIDATNPQYIFETRFNKSETNAGVVTKPSEASWDEESADDTELVQKTKTSVKFTLPKADKKSIYAVKLNASNKEVDSDGKRVYEDKIIYINNPYITYTMGDDGEISTAGGTLRIIGENLYVDDAHTVTVVAKSLDTRDITSLEVTKVTKGDAYSVEVAIPKTLAMGKYEVYLHNGYGDNTCWSAPVVFTVGASARSIWRSKGTFNVKDYGAKGNDTANDTGAIVRAIDAAYQNGGGVVYFPKGKYRVISTIVVPQNISLEGEDLSNTMIFWTADTWQYGEAKHLFSISGNCEIKNLNIYASRSKSFVYFNADKYPSLISNLYPNVNNPKVDNVYLENLNFDTCPTAGMPGSGGGHGFSTVEGTNDSEIKALEVKEAQVDKIKLNVGGKNYQAKNINVYVETTDKGSNVYGISATGFYVNISGYVSDNNGFGLYGRVRNAIIENNTVFGATCTITGSNMYFARNELGVKYSNNRELWVADGKPYYQNVRIQFIGAREDIMGAGKTDKVTYKLLGYSNFAKDAFVGYEVFVADGQGYGQMRVITSSKTDGTFTVDQPFTIAPNRNSAIWIFHPRTTYYFVQNSFAEGSTCAPYGTSVDSVFDGNTFSYHSGQQFTTNETIIWYTSVLNEVYRNPLYIHGEGYGGAFAGEYTDCKIYFNMVVSPLPASFMGTVIKNNDFDAYYIHIRCAGLNDVCRDFIVENNKMADAPYGVNHNGADSYKFDGMYIRNNDFVTTGKTYSDVLVNAKNNTLGYKRCIIVTAGQDVFILGDVNLDGEVNIKDSTLIRYYYIKTVQFTDEQLLRADANSDGDINLKDSTRIKQHVAYDVPLGKLIDWYPGTW